VFARRSQLFGLQCLVQDLALTLLAFPVAYLLRTKVVPHFTSLGPIYPIQVYWPLLVALLIVWPVIGWVSGFYRQVDPREKLRLAREAIALSTISSTVLFAVLYLLHGGYVSRSLVVILWAVDCVFVLCGRWFLFSASAWLRGRMERFRYFLIVGTDAAARELAEFIEQGKSFGDRLIGFAYTGPMPPGELKGRYRLIPVETLPELLEREPVDEVVFAVTREELAVLEPILRRCQEDGVHTRVHLDFLPLNVSRVYLEHLRDVPLLTFASSPDNEVLLFLKRMLDVALASVVLVVLSPAMLLIALLIKLNSPGPIIYRQVRCGVGGRRFTLYKFRSMVADAEKLRPQLEMHNEAEGPIFKMTNDPRVTSVGRWLRRFSLDELPQLWNILRGDMSFVGPRPPLAEEVAQYEKWQRRRLRMRPGLTCLWAIEGRSRVKFDRWMQLDLAYIDNWSLWLDLKIVLKTIPHVLRGRGAF
jgi:exopolysaccharide biosynthesis polyprenyl glycosylphosphotransferase